MSADPYTYDNGTLRNRFDITDADELVAVEADVTTTRITEIESFGLPGRFDLAHLRLVHRQIFGDLYYWAGELRTVDISKGSSLFCLARFLPSAAEQVFEDLVPVRRLIVPDNDLPVGLANWNADLNALHPFREGNGRAQRTFIWLVCMSVGIRLDMAVVTAAGNLAASVAAMNGDSTGFHAALRLAAGQSVAPGDERWIGVLTA